MIHEAINCAHSIGAFILRSEPVDIFGSIKAATGTAIIQNSLISYFPAMLRRGILFCKNTKRVVVGMCACTLSYFVLHVAAKTSRTVFLVARRQNSAVSGI